MNYEIPGVENLKTEEDNHIKNKNKDNKKVSQEEQKKEFENTEKETSLETDTLEKEKAESSDRYLKLKEALTEENRTKLLEVFWSHLDDDRKKLLKEEKVKEVTSRFLNEEENAFIGEIARNELAKNELNSIKNKVREIIFPSENFQKFWKDVEENSTEEATKPDTESSQEQKVLINGLKKEIADEIESIKGFLEGFQKYPKDNSNFEGFQKLADRGIRAKQFIKGIKEKNETGIDLKELEKAIASMSSEIGYLCFGAPENIVGELKNGMESFKQEDAFKDKEKLTEEIEKKEQQLEEFEKILVSFGINIEVAPVYKEMVKSIVVLKEQKNKLESTGDTEDEESVEARQEDTPSVENAVDILRENSFRQANELEELEQGLTQKILTLLKVQEKGLAALTDEERITWAGIGDITIEKLEEERGKIVIEKEFCLLSARANVGSDVVRKVMPVLGETLKERQSAESREERRKSLVDALTVVTMLEKGVNIMKDATEKSAVPSHNRAAENLSRATRQEGYGTPSVETQPQNAQKEGIFSISTEDMDSIKRFDEKEADKKFVTTFLDKIKYLEEENYAVSKIEKEIRSNNTNGKKEFKITLKTYLRKIGKQEDFRLVKIEAIPADGENNSETGEKGKIAIRIVEETNLETNSGSRPQPAQNDNESGATRQGVSPESPTNQETPQERAAIEFLKKNWEVKNDIAEVICYLNNSIAYTEQNTIEDILKSSTKLDPKKITSFKKEFEAKLGKELKNVTKDNYRKMRSTVSAEIAREKTGTRGSNSIGTNSPKNSTNQEIQQEKAADKQRSNLQEIRRIEQSIGKASGSDIFFIRNFETEKGDKLLKFLLTLANVSDRKACFKEIRADQNATHKKEKRHNDNVSFEIKWKDEQGVEKELIIDADTKNQKTGIKNSLGFDRKKNKDVSIIITSKNVELSKGTDAKLL
ncbi:MAG: hypothetical protein WC178_01045 [Candidatus Paceibacterota bacterium]